jgi:hypothetical protein
MNAYQLSNNSHSQDRRPSNGWGNERKSNDSRSGDWRGISETQEWTTVGSKPIMEMSRKLYSRTSETKGDGIDGTDKSVRSTGSFKEQAGHAKSSGHAKSAGHAKSVGHAKSAGHNAKFAIRSWAESKKACSDMVNEYNRSAKSWEEPSVSNFNRTLVIKELASNLRAEVLSELFHSKPGYTIGLTTKGYTPLQYVAFPNKRIADSVTVDDMIATARVLIEEYKFRIFADDDRKQETIFGALQSKHNPLPSEISGAFYKYLTCDASISWFIPNFKANLGKLVTSNVELFQNKFLLVVDRFPREAAKIFVSQLMTIRSTQSVRIGLVELPIQTLLSVPNTSDTEMDKYFETVDIRVQQTRFVNEILVNGHEWILPNLAVFDEGSVEYCDRLTLNSRIFFSVIGAIYAQGFAKSEILARINRLINDPSRPAWAAPSIAMFLTHCNIVSNSASATETESKMVIDFIKACYPSANFKNKVDIEVATGLTPLQAKSLIVDTTPVIHSLKMTDSDAPNWDKILAEAGDEIAEDD